MNTGMNCELHMLCCCLVPREILILWGYGKLAIDIFMLLTAAIPGAEVLFIFLLHEKTASQLAASVIYTILINLWMLDLVLNSMLVFGVHKGKVNILKIYYTYTKVLWVLVTILGVAYFMIEFDKLLWFVGMWDTDLKAKTFSNICTMFATLIIQTLVLLSLKREIKELIITNGNNKRQGFEMGFSLKIERISEAKKEKGEKNAQEKNATTSEKATVIE